jgi:hypothetical protein
LVFHRAAEIHRIDDTEGGKEAEDSVSHRTAPRFLVLAGQYDGMLSQAQEGAEGATTNLITNTPKAEKGLKSHHPITALE